jgi:beta-phosphoglucomutase-like phosphatase (HAD superfamily)
MLKNIIFDFDGVIHNTFEFHLDAINRFAPQVGLSAEEYRGLHDGTVYNQSLFGRERQIDFSQYPAFVHVAQGALVTDAYVKQSLVAFSHVRRLFW